MNGPSRRRGAGRHSLRVVDDGHDVDRRLRRGCRGRQELVSALPVARPRGEPRLATRAEAAGYEALVLTVDTPIAGARLRDVRNGLTIPPSLTLKTFAEAHCTPRGGSTSSPPSRSSLLRSTASTAPSRSWPAGCRFVSFSTVIKGASVYIPNTVFYRTKMKI